MLPGLRPVDQRSSRSAGEASYVCERSSPATRPHRSPVAPRRFDVVPNSAHRLTREQRDPLGHRDHLLSVLLIRRGESRLRTIEEVAEIDPGMLGLGQARERLGADPARVSGDGIAGDIELSVGVPDRMVHVVHERNQIRRALASHCDGGNQRRTRLAQSAQVGERVGVHPSLRDGGEGCLQLADHIRDAARARLIECGSEVLTALLDERHQHRLRSQRLDLEGFDGIEQACGSLHRCSGCLERDARLLAVTGRMSHLGHSHAVLGEPDQSIGLRGVAVNPGERLAGIPGGKPIEGVAGVRDACAQPLEVGSHGGDDPGRTPHPPGPVGEGSGLPFERVLGPLAELHDAQVAGAHLIDAAGHRVVIEPVQSERVVQVRAHLDERLAQLRRRVGPQLRLGEPQIVDRDADAFVGGDQSQRGLLRQVGVANREFRRTACAPDPETSDPETGHGESNDRCSRPACQRFLDS